MKKREIISLKEALEDYLKERKWDKRIEGYQIIKDWKEIAGEELANNAQPIKMEGSILWLQVRSSVWANELNWRKGEIMERINVRSPGLLVSDIKFKVKSVSFNEKT